MLNGYHFLALANALAAIAFSVAAILQPFPSGAHAFLSFAFLMLLCVSSSFACLFIAERTSAHRKAIRRRLQQIARRHSY